MWFVVAAICTYVIGYRFSARLIETKIVRPRDDHATPAEVFDDGTDYVPTDRRVLFGHHFAAIAGAGPLVGPVLATQLDYLPCSIWTIVGAVFAGAVQDYLVMVRGLAESPWGVVSIAMTIPIAVIRAATCDSSGPDGSAKCPSSVSSC